MTDVHANPLEGEVPLQAGGRTLRLRLDWRAAGQLYALAGEDWSKALDDAFNKQDGDALEFIARSIAITAAAADPEQSIEADEIMRRPPSIVGAREAFLALHNLFYIGAPDLQPEPEEKPEEGGQVPLPNSTSWASSGGRLLRRVFGRANSGGSPATRRSSGSGPGMQPRASAP